MRTYAALDRLVLRRFDGVVAVSAPVQDTLRRWGVREERLTLIPNGVDVERFQYAMPTLRKETGTTDGALVGFVGRLVPDKGGALLLRAAQKVLAARPNTQFVFVGEGPSRPDWERLAAELGIARSVVFTGTRSDMPGVYASIDILALPSLVESMPMCMLEAMAASKAVAAARVGAIPEIIIPERTGLLLAPGDVNGLAQAILRLVENPRLAGELGRNACLQVQQNYSAQAMAKAYVERYQAIIARRNAAAPMRSRVKADAGCM